MLMVTCSNSCVENSKKSTKGDTFQQHVYS